MPKRLHITRQQTREIVSAYEQKTASVNELSVMYSINTSSIYRLLHRNGVPTGGRQQVQEVEVVNVEEERVHNNHQMVVTTDNQNIVQSAQPVRRANISTWEIRYTGTIFIDAADVDEAIMEARKMGVVKRIYSVRVRSS
jgi:transposase-like protein